MKTYEAKSESKAVELAANDLKIPADQVKYAVVSDVKKLFGRKVTIGVYTKADVIEYAVNLLETICETLELKVNAEASLADDVIKIDINADIPSVVIGRSGENLRALNELVRSAVFNRFGEHYRILLNCDSYKEDKYARLVRAAKHAAWTVKKTGVKVSLDPMTSDERRVIHNALANDKRVTTLSEGTGRFRHITINRVELPTESVKEEPVVSEEKTDVQE